MASEATNQASTLSEGDVSQFEWDKVDPTGKETADFLGSSEENTDNILDKDEAVEIEPEEEVEEDDDFTELSEEEVEELDEDGKEEYETKLKERNNKLAEKEKAKKVVKKAEPVPKKADKPAKEIVAGADADDDENSPKEVYAALLSDLKEEGLLEVEMPKNTKKGVSRKEFFEKIAENDDKKLDNTIKELFSNLDERGAAFIKFIKEGGKTEDFLDTFVNDSIPELDPNDPKTHDSILMYYYKEVDGQSEEEAKESIELLTESADKNKKAKTAIRVYNKMKTADDEKKAELLEATTRKNKKAEKQASEFAVKLRETTSLEDVLGVPLTKEDNKILPDYITKPAKTKDGQKLTGFQYDLSEILKDEKKLVALAKIIKNGLNLDFIKKQAVNTVAKNTRRSLETLAKDGKGVRTTGTAGKRSLADYFA